MSCSMGQPLRQGEVKQLVRGSGQSSLCEGTGLTGFLYLGASATASSRAATAATSTASLRTAPLSTPAIWLKRS